MVENKKILKVLNMPLKKGIKQLFGLNTIHFFKDINKLKVVKLQNEYNKKIIGGKIKC